MRNCKLIAPSEPPEQRHYPAPRAGVIRIVNRQCPFAGCAALRLQRKSARDARLQFGEGQSEQKNGRGDAGADVGHGTLKISLCLIVLYAALSLIAVARYEFSAANMKRQCLVSDKPFEPSTVTKPIQLLSAWLIGLIVVNGSFLSAAAVITRPHWASGFLIICAAICVPTFLGALFLLQTRFRPEMQEDTFYSKYLERTSSETKKGEVIKIDRIPVDPVRMNERISAGSVGRSRTISHRNFHGRGKNQNDISIRANDLVENYEEVFSTLITHGITITDTFGSTSENPNIPTKRVISFGGGDTSDAFKTIVRILRPLGFDWVSYSPSSLHHNNIYIGSYIYESKPDRPKLLTEEMYQKIQSAEDVDELIDILESA